MRSPAAGQHPLRIVQLTAPGRFGGLETVVQQLSAGLHRRGHEVCVLCRLDTGVDPDQHPLVSALRRSGVDVQAFSLPHRAYFTGWREITRRLRAFGADIVHTHGYHADVIGALAARAASVPRVSTAHGFTGGGWKNRLFEALQRRSYRSAAAVIAVSEPLAERLARDSRISRAVTCLPNAWARSTHRLAREAARRELGLSSDAVVVGWVGRMTREKGPDLAVAALDDPAAAHLTLCMVGEGPMRAELSGSAAGGPGARVVWAGAVPDAGRLFSAFDALLLSSRTEGTPMVLLEAMDAGVPIVATRVGGVPNVLGPEEAALAPPEDPAALRAALLTTLADDEKARQQAVRAAARLDEEFGADSWLAAHEAIYRRAADRGRGQRR